MVTVEVGPPKEIFVVHEKFLCQKSQYFAKAMSGSFLESVKRFVQLPDVSPTLFRIFINWLYYGKLCYAGEDDEKTGMNLQNLVIQPEEIGLIPTRSSNSIRKSKVEDDENGTKCVTKSPDSSTEFAPSTNDKADRVPGKTHSNEPQNCLLDGDDPSTWPLDALAKLYIFADRFDSHELRVHTVNALCDALANKREGHRGMSNWLIRYICLNTTAQSMLRRLAIHRIVYNVSFHPDTAKSFLWEELPSDFLAAVVIAMGRRLPVRQCSTCHRRALVEGGIIEVDIDDVCKEADCPPYESDACFYHEHANDQEKETCCARRTATK